MLFCKDLSVGYGAKAVLSNINFILPEASLTVLVGANGSGKSTLLRTIAGNQKALAGQICISSTDIQKIKSRDLARLRALVDTSKTGGGGLSVSEAVAIGRYTFVGWAGKLSDKDKRVVDRALKSVGMSSFATRHLAELSDGERQKVMIARAIAQQTPVLMLDEPTAFLDVAARHEILQLLRKLADDGKTIILSTHDIAPAVMNADYILAVDSQHETAKLMPKNEMIESGILDKIFASSGLHFDIDALDFRR